MSEADGQQEPSMEEILASIRRIISEDGESEEAEPKAAEPEAAAPEPAPPAEPEPAPPEPEPVPEDTLPEPDDDDVLELTEIVEDEDETMVGLDQAPPPDFGEEEPAPQLPPDAGEPFVPPEPEDEPESLISDQAAAAAAGSLAVLSTAAGRKIADQLGASDIGGVTVEELVRQLLRPMLREWLDENLPPMVERLVRREIERLAAQGGQR